MNVSLSSVLVSAIQNENLKDVKLIINKFAYLRLNDIVCDLMRRVRHEERHITDSMINIIEYILKHHHNSSMDVSEKDDFLFRYAIFCEDILMSKYLLKKNTNVNNSDGYALEYSIYGFNYNKNNIKFIKYLIKMGANIGPNIGHISDIFKQYSLRDKFVEHLKKYMKNKNTTVNNIVNPIVLNKKLYMKKILYYKKLF